LKNKVLVLLFLEVFLGFLFYLIIRPNIVLFGLFNLKLKPLLVFQESIFLNSFPSLLSSVITFTIAFLLLIGKPFKLNFINKLVVISGILSEFSQLLFSSRATFDFWDLVFSLAGSLIMFFILGRFKSANEDC
jgi:hypothetical protein